MSNIVLFEKRQGYYLVGDPKAPVPWVGDNPEALHALHEMASYQAWHALAGMSGGVDSASASYQRLRNAARGLERVAPLLAAELERGVKRKTSGRHTLWRYDSKGALAFVETRPSLTSLDSPLTGVAPPQ
ncbi:hypothetical protein [Pusillimonas sp. ANT_WB101]|uniref:hypothetical protein n=1 Tax=Pusillimonas sp. ANT_WB101 TaxID=2597356 RepID=UPI0011EF6E7D|nr:hypothetical protein [Pusillimonas sp. ANT_WB101]KAA0889932.1 hypothetical protein FQ179_16375 [Pusillimonas sp. ANT_WB101]